MKANLLWSLSFLLGLSISMCFAARAARARQRGGQTNPAAQGDVPAGGNIEVENWTKPEPGWLYVLDPKPAAGEPGGRIWLVDPEAAQVMGSIRTGDAADFALSPDGSTLYVASRTGGDSSELAVIDTADGVVLERSDITGRAVT